MGILSKLMKKDVKKLRPFPFTVNGANLRYAYDMEITPASPRSVAAALGNEEKVVDVAVNNGKIELSHNGTVFGTISDATKCRMVSDFIKRGDPVNAILREDGTISLRFYRDMRNGAKESEVVTLTAYKSKACQEVIEYISAGAELGCLEDGGKLLVCEYFTHDNVLGKLPPKIAKRAEDEDIRAIYYEETQEEINDNYETVYIPVVRVYW